MKIKKKVAPSTREQRLKKRQLNRLRKPEFKRQESWRYKKVKENWRKPRGIDSKMRKKVKGWPPSPGVGYRSSKKVRGIHPSGYVEVRVQTVESIYGMDSTKQAIRIAHSVGGKKRVEILTLAEELGVHVLNPRIVRKSEEFEEGMQEEEEIENDEN